MARRAFERGMVFRAGGVLNEAMAAGAHADMWTPLSQGVPLLLSAPR
ncbi:hypothetical protein HCN51_45745 [Nonomuraea sp. FMUSA5-5]|uniref:Uncharacterized protein n=1 Tax=Nonomuraea composti TaxID=2720023 RepID=A0ABX1BK20_9ACTN|nr:hypothetical protein [Nonomuraea sp. FMUSA5-5]NJP96657.1 hypothetical protein [Nonomuraea sp. FMUSA5-5]